MAGGGPWHLLGGMACCNCPSHFFSPPSAPGGTLPGPGSFLTDPWAPCRNVAQNLLSQSAGFPGWGSDGLIVCGWSAPNHWASPLCTTQQGSMACRLSWPDSAPEQLRAALTAVFCALWKRGEATGEPRKTPREWAQGALPGTRAMEPAVEEVVWRRLLPRGRRPLGQAGEECGQWHERGPAGRRLPAEAPESPRR